MLNPTKITKKISLEKTKNRILKFNYLILLII